MTPDLGLRGGQDPLLGAETRPWGGWGLTEGCNVGKGLGPTSEGDR